ncbi:MAG: ABC transporter ATP-binding protein/permease [Candidatus Heimdallarchaeota archaeon]|nr:ABC transporter ATP-binding protein/permease [Candidatus Heimdallarchaeota archaeon]
MGHGGGAGRMIGRIADRKKATRPTRVLLKALSKYLKGFVGLLVLAAFLSLAYSGTQILNPIILSNGIDAIDPSLGKVIVWFGVTLSERTIIIIYTLFYVLLGSVGFILNSLTTRLLSKVRADMVHKIRKDVYNKLINASMDYLKKEQSGNITARITSDTDEVSTGLQVFISIAVQLFLLVTTLVVILIRLPWQIVLICLGSIPFALLLSFVLSTIGRRIVLGIRQTFGIVSGKIAESFAGIAVSKAFNQEGNLSSQMRVLNQENYKMSKKFGLMMNIMMPLISSISSIVTAAILWMGGYLASISIGQIFLGTILAAQFLRPVAHLSLSFPQLQTSLGAVDRVLDVLEASPSIPDAPNAEPLGNDYSVSFEHVWFSYDNENWVLKDITFQVEEGEMVALVGETGAGKTTLASMLLTRFYDIQKGSIKIGDQDIKKITQKSLRRAIGLIPQEPYLFTATVLENIKYGKPDATDEEVYSICKMIGADTFIEALPNGYQTIVREGGKQLSAGQRQIITIARTMLADPKILILDEATSRLDAYSESLVQVAQRTLFKNRTTFVIAHRLSTIFDANKIVVLSHGELVEMGSHEELIRKKGLYADIYETYYKFQGLEEIDVGKVLEEEEEEEVELSPLAMMEMGMLNPEKIKKMVAEGKISPAMLEQLKKKMAQKKAKTPID